MIQTRPQKFGQGYFRHYDHNDNPDVSILSPLAHLIVLSYLLHICNFGDIAAQLHTLGCCSQMDLNMVIDINTMIVNNIIIDINIIINIAINIIIVINIIIIIVIDIMIVINIIIIIVIDIINTKNPIIIIMTSVSAGLMFIARPINMSSIALSPINPGKKLSLRVCF